MLPMDRPRPAVQTTIGFNSIMFCGHASLLDKLQHKSSRMGHTFMTLLASYQVSLLGYTDKTDIMLAANCKIQISRN